MFFRKLALLAKIETAYGIDAVPTGAANAMLALNVNVTPLEITEEARDFYQPYLGNSGSIVTSFYGKLSFEIEAAGAGAAGTAPKYGPLLRACSLAEAISAGVSVTYTPVSGGYEAVSMYFYLDGVLHKFLGARGSVALDMTASKVPKWKFDFTGIFQPVVDAALPAASYASFITPVVVSKANTPTFTLHGVSPVMQSLNINLANEVRYRNLVNYEGVDNVDRKPMGNTVFESNLMAVKNWFDLARTKTSGALSLVHGITAGNIIQVAAPAALISKPSYQESDGIVMLSTGLELLPSSGNDEASFIVK